MGNTPVNERQALIRAVAMQQKRIDQLDRIVNEIASFAGLSKHVASLRKQADEDNPAQPVPNPASESATESTQQAATPEAYDNVQNPGTTPGSVNEVPAETTTVALEPGTALDTQPFTNLVNVQAPVAGTETHVPDEMTRIETDVRVSPNASPVTNPAVAFPLVGGATASAGDRTMAALRLARLQIGSGTAPDGVTDDLALGARIAKSSATDQEIALTIQTLESVRKAASAKAAARPANLVPRTASGERSNPSLVGGSHTASVVGNLATDADLADADLFD